MARFERLLIPALATVLLTVSATAQESTPTVKDAGEADRREDQRENRRRDGKRKMSPEMQNVRRAIEALSPEQRKRFEENFSKWVNLPPEEKKSLRHRDEIRRKRMAQEVDEAVQKSGLALDATEKEQFARRYAEERRKLEEELRKEMEEKRQPRLDVIVGQLAKEFTATAETPAASQP